MTTPRARGKFSAWAKVPASAGRSRAEVRGILRLSDFRRVPTVPRDGSIQLPSRVVSPRYAKLLAAGLIVAAGWAAYSGSFTGPFVFDDPSSITANPTIHRLWPLWDVLETPRANVTVQGRPVLNLSFALNYAFGGSAVHGYHVVNLWIHLAAGLTLFGLVRRTLARTAVDGASEIRATVLAFAVAGLWTVHPLQTESVTYVVQRAESLMGLFYLLTFYAFSRSAEAIGGRERHGWAFVSVLACWAGMATKEVMVSAPVLVFLYDRTFLAGGFAAAWRRRWWHYVALGAGWLILLLCLLRGGGNRGGAIGLGSGVGWWTYGLTQFEAIGRYLLLSVWPHPLVFEYGAFTVQDPTEVVPWAMLVVPLVAGTCWALWRRPVGGFLGFWFLALLAPTSLVPGTSQMIVEHRMYLSLAAVLTALVVALHAAIERLAPAMARRGAGLFLAVIFPFGVAAVGVTFARNEVYRSELSLWSDTVAKRPANPIAHAMLAEALLAAGRSDPALVHFEAAVRLDPTFFVAHERLGELLVRLGRAGEAEVHLREALRLRPDFADAHNQLGLLCAATGRAEEAVERIGRALTLKPEYPEAHFALANTLAGLDRHREAVGHYQTAAALLPDHPAVRYNWANSLAALGRNEEAVAGYREALRLRPNHPATEFNLANSLAGLRRVAEAVAHYQRALQLKPDWAAAELNLGNALLELGRADEAEAHYVAALRLEPQMAEARASLARLRAVRVR